MEDIFLVGPSYCGKTEFTKYLEKELGHLGIITVHVGDCIRELCKKKKKETPVTAGTDLFYDVLEAQIIPEVLDAYIIDNAFKNKEQFNHLKEYWDYIGRDWLVYWVEDKRTNVDFTSRGREDDDMIEKKRHLWELNKSEIWQVLTTNYPNRIRIVENTDNGFIVKKWDKS